MKALWARQPVRWLAVAAWLGLIFFLSAQPKLPDLTGFHLEIQDVLGHFVAYGGLAVLLQQALRGSGMSSAAAWAWGLAVLYGFTDEFHQHFVPGRNPDIFDILTDAAGAAFALWVFHRLAQRIRGVRIDS